MERSYLMRKQGQGWGLDVVAAVVIFISGVIILYVYALNYTSQTQDTLNELTYEAHLAADLVLSNDDTGILVDNVVNQSKLDLFNASYLSRKGFFGMSHDFYFTLDGVGPFGKLNESAVTDEIAVNRITIYQNKLAPFVLRVYKT